MNQVIPSPSSAIMKCDIAESRRIRLNARLSAVVILTLGFSFSALPISGAPIQCKFEQQMKSNIYGQRYERQCTKEYETCLNDLQADGQKREMAARCLSHVFRRQREIEGPCPKLLEEVEAAPEEDYDETLAKIFLRARFSQILPDDDIRRIQFRREDSIETLRLILDNEPDNLFAQFLLISNLTAAEEQIERLSLSVELLQRDHLCDLALDIQVGSVLAQFRHFFSSYIRGAEPGSNLQSSEMETLTRQVSDAVTTAYWSLWNFGPPFQTTDLAFQISNSLIDFATDEERETFYELLGAGRSVEREEDRKRIRHEITDRYSLNSSAERGTQLAMMCNDYAFEQGLLSECMRLIKHYSMLDKLAHLPFSRDLYDASLRSLVAVTRDCSGRVNYVLSFSLIRNFIGGSCFNAYENHGVEAVEEMLDSYGDRVDLWHANILRAYSRLDGKVAEHFKLALTSNLMLFPHVLLLSKRLSDRGNRTAAIGVVQAAIELAKDIGLEKTSRYKRAVVEVMAYSILITEFQDSLRKASDLDSLLRTILLELETGNRLKFLEAQFP